MERYKNERRINENDHIETLRELGYDTNTFDCLKSYEDITNDENECIVCYDPPRDHMIMPCNCVCLCPECAEDNFPPPHDGQKCPSCGKDIQSIKQIFCYW